MDWADVDFSDDDLPDPALPETQEPEVADWSCDKLEVQESDVEEEINSDAEKPFTKLVSFSNADKRRVTSKGREGGDSDSFPALQDPRKKKVKKRKKSQQFKQSKQKLSSSDDDSDSQSFLSQQPRKSSQCAKIERCDGAQSESSDSESFLSQNQTKKTFGQNTIVETEPSSSDSESLFTNKDSLFSKYQDHETTDMRDYSKLSENNENCKSMQSTSSSARNLFSLFEEKDHEPVKEEDQTNTDSFNADDRGDNNDLFTDNDYSEEHRMYVGLDSDDEDMYLSQSVPVGCLDYDTIVISSEGSDQEVYCIEESDQDDWDKDGNDECDLYNVQTQENFNMPSEDFNNDHGTSVKESDDSESDLYSASTQVNNCEGNGNLKAKQCSRNTLCGAEKEENEEIYFAETQAPNHCDVEDSNIDDCYLQQTQTGWEHQSLSPKENLSEFPEDEEEDLYNAETQVPLDTVSIFSNSDSESSRDDPCYFEPTQQTSMNISAHESLQELVHSMCEEDSEEAISSAQNSECDEDVCQTVAKAELSCKPSDGESSPKPDHTGVKSYKNIMQCDSFHKSPKKDQHRVNKQIAPDDDVYNLPTQELFKEDSETEDMDDITKDHERQTQIEPTNFTQRFRKGKTICQRQSSVDEFDVSTQIIESDKNKTEDNVYTRQTLNAECRRPTQVTGDDDQGEKEAEDEDYNMPTQVESYEIKRHTDYNRQTLIWSNEPSEGANEVSNTNTEDDVFNQQTLNEEYNMATQIVLDDDTDGNGSSDDDIDCELTKNKKYNRPTQDMLGAVEDENGEINSECNSQMLDDYNVSTQVIPKDDNNGNNQAGIADTEDDVYNSETLIDEYNESTQIMESERNCDGTDAEIYDKETVEDVYNSLAQLIDGDHNLNDANDFCSKGDKEDGIGDDGQEAHNGDIERATESKSNGDMNNLSDENGMIGHSEGEYDPLYDIPTQVMSWDNHSELDNSQKTDSQQTLPFSPRNDDLECLPTGSSLPNTLQVKEEKESNESEEEISLITIDDSDDEGSSCPSSVVNIQAKQVTPVEERRHVGGTSCQGNENKSASETFEKDLSHKVEVEVDGLDKPQQVKAAGFKCTVSKLQETSSSSSDEKNVYRFLSEEEEDHRPRLEENTSAVSLKESTPEKEKANQHNDIGNDKNHYNQKMIDDTSMSDADYHNSSDSDHKNIYHSLAVLQHESLSRKVTICSRSLKERRKEIGQHSGSNLTSQGPSHTQSNLTSQGPSHTQRSNEALIPGDTSKSHFCKTYEKHASPSDRQVGRNVWEDLTQNQMTTSVSESRVCHETHIDDVYNQPTQVSNSSDQSFSDQLRRKHCDLTGSRTTQRLSTWPQTSKKRALPVENNDKIKNLPKERGMPKPSKKLKMGSFASPKKGLRKRSKSCSLTADHNLGDQVKRAKLQLDERSRMIKKPSKIVDVTNKLKEVSKKDDTFKHTVAKANSQYKSGQKARKLRGKDLVSKSSLIQAKDSDILSKILPQALETNDKCKQTSTSDASEKANPQKTAMIEKGDTIKYGVSSASATCRDRKGSEQTCDGIDPITLSGNQEAVEKCLDKSGAEKLKKSELSGTERHSRQNNDLEARQRIEMSAYSEGTVYNKTDTAQEYISRQQDTDSIGKGIMKTENCNPQSQDATKNEFKGNQVGSTDLRLTVIPIEPALLVNAEENNHHKGAFNSKVKSLNADNMVSKQSVLSTSPSPTRRVRFDETEAETYRAACRLLNEDDKHSGLRKPNPAYHRPNTLRETNRRLPQSSTSLKKPQLKAEFIDGILKWTPKWLREQGDPMKPPPLEGEGKGWNRLEIFYESYLHYTHTTLGLLKLELWEELSKEWLNYNRPEGDTREVLLLRSDSENDSDRNPSEVCEVRVKMNSGTKMAISQGDILLLFIKSEKVKNRDHKSELMQFAYVKDVERPRGMEKRQHTSLTIKTKRRLLSSKDRGPLIAVKLSSLMQVEWHITALENLQRKAFIHQVIQNPAEPGVASVFHAQHISKLRENAELNKEQAAAELAIRTAVLHLPHREPKVFLLQGPPGTGKSHTIVTLIYEILVSSKFAKHICVVAPSNAAVDELAWRIIVFSKRLQQRQRNQHIRMVRVGNKSRVRPNVKDYYLDTLVESRANREAELRASNSQKAEAKILKNKIAKLEKSINNNNFAEKAAKEAQIKQLQKQLMDVYPKPKLEDFEDLRVEELKKSHVLCGTLSSFGSSRLLRQIANIEFACIIIDEATQAKEVECLLPLQINCNKLVLVGDPNQLQPVVTNPKAKELMFGRSLFARLSFQVPQVLKLRCQYRMSDEILKFPNSTFYEGDLYTDRKVQDRSMRDPYSLAPYLVFDFVGGEEAAHDPEVNLAEAEATAILCQLVSETMKISQGQRTVFEERIAVICPYTKQRAEVLKRLSQRNLRKIAVETVDSFQGQEKDVIIMSCVRSHSGLGFLVDRERMNVALTRAKYALYVLGHFNTLKKDDLWEAFHADAHKRKVLVEVQQMCDFTRWAQERVVTRKLTTGAAVSKTQLH